FKRGCLLAAHQVFESIRSSGVVPGPRLSAFEAWQVALLGDEQRALRIAARLYHAPEADSEARVYASLLLLHFGTKPQVLKAQSALEVLAHYKARFGEDRYSYAKAVSLVREGPLWKVLALTQLCLCYERDGAAEFVETLRAAGASRDILSLVLGWLLDEIHALGGSGVSEEEKRLAGRCLRYVDTYLERRSQEAEVGIFDMLLLAKRERATTLDNLEEAAALPRSLLTFAHEMEVFLFNQQNSYQRQRLEAQARQNDFRRTHPDELRADTPESKKPPEMVPALYIRLFGGLEVRIGEKLIDPRLFSRRKVKVLLALLVLNQGKEFSRERLCKILWPDSEPAASRRNLYTVWSQLRKALVGTAGSCPYLIHTQFSYKLDAYTASSDVAEFEALCRRLLFSYPNLETWSQAFVEIDELYSDDLLPTETENPYIVQARMEYRTRLVDALCTAAYRLFDAGELQASLWFARAAISRDSAREDVYTVLMQAQIALGQRAAALETYFKCRHYLVEELGIDPSEKAFLLYSSIIADAPGLASAPKVLTDGRWA
ncbi:MAG: hypothetical protein FWD72_04760, partial [Eggerthellaceae bacterium]|nr:hypothetical protein [Eggerthellaceae bacterium]